MIQCPSRPPVAPPKIVKSPIDDRTRALPLPGRFAHAKEDARVPSRPREKLQLTKMRRGRPIKPKRDIAALAEERTKPILSASSCVSPPAFPLAVSSPRLLWRLGAVGRYCLWPCSISSSTGPPSDPWASSAASPSNSALSAAIRSNRIVVCGRAPAPSLRSAVRRPLASLLLFLFPQADVPPNSGLNGSGPAATAEVVIAIAITEIALAACAPPYQFNIAASGGMRAQSSSPGRSASRPFAFYVLSRAETSLNSRLCRRDGRARCWHRSGPLFRHYGLRAEWRPHFGQLGQHRPYLALPLAAADAIDWGNAPARSRQSSACSPQPLCGGHLLCRTARSPRCRRSSRPASSRSLSPVITRNIRLGNHDCHCGGGGEPGSASGSSLRKLGVALRSAFRGKR